MSWTLKKTESKKVWETAQPKLRNIVMKDRQIGFINFDKMKGRPKFSTLQQTGNPHAKRFDNLNAFPRVSSKAK